MLAEPKDDLPTCEGGGLQLCRDEEFGTVLDGTYTVCQLAEPGNGEIDGLAVAATYVQGEITVVHATLPGLFDLSVVSGISDQQNPDVLLIQISSPPPRIPAYSLCGCDERGPTEPGVVGCIPISEQERVPT